MKRNREPIRVEAYVRVGDREVNVDKLTQEQKVRLATWLKKTYLNELFRGQVTFYEADEGVQCRSGGRKSK